MIYLVVGYGYNAVEEKNGFGVYFVLSLNVLK
jgi:hypothetical protein